MTVRAGFTPGSLARVKKVLNRLNPEVEMAVIEGSRESAEEMADMARGLASRRTAATIRVEKTENGARVVAGDETTLVPVRVGSTVMVQTVRLEEFGTAPHLIKPTKEGGKLFIPGKGFVDEVRHPGAAPNPFFWPSYRAVKPVHKKRLPKKVTGAIKKAKRA